MSTAPPGGNPTMMRTGLTGYCCASAVAVLTRASVPAARDTIRAAFRKRVEYWIDADCALAQLSAKTLNTAGLRSEIAQNVMAASVQYKRWEAPAATGF